MPFYQVRKGHDAYKGYSTVIEAEDIKDALEAASSADDWIENGEDPEFDDYTIFEDGVTPIEATSLEEAQAKMAEEYNCHEVILTPRERNTVLAALRHWQEHITKVEPGLFEDDTNLLVDIATDGGTMPPMDAEAIDRLCEEINCG